MRTFVITTKDNHLPYTAVPRMNYIKDDEYQLLEECAPGQHLTADLFKTLSRRQQYEIIDGVAAFLVDMNELKPVQKIQRHKIAICPFSLVPFCAAPFHGAVQTFSRA